MEQETLPEAQWIVVVVAADTGGIFWHLHVYPQSCVHGVLETGYIWAKVSVSTRQVDEADNSYTCADLVMPRSISSDACAGTM